MISSSPAFNPDNTKIDYSDIEKIFKANPDNYKVEEVRVAGKFHSYNISTS